MFPNPNQPTERAHINTRLKTRRKEAKFVDRYASTSFANMLAENLIGQVSEEGHSKKISAEILSEIICYRRNHQTKRRIHDLEMASTEKKELNPVKNHVLDRKMVEKPG